MKCLLRTIGLMAVMAICVPSMAQFKLGAKAGLNISNVNHDEPILEPKWRTFIHLGAIAEYELAESFALQSGLSYTRKGFMIDMGEYYHALNIPIDIDGYIKTHYNYLEIPIHAVYKINALQIFAGPYFAFGIGGKVKTKYTITGGYIPGYVEQISDEAKLRPVFGKYDPNKYGDDEGVYNALDIGLNVGVGYELGPVLINAGYSWGWSNIVAKPKQEQPNPDDFENLKNSVFTASVSYFFLEN